MVKIISKTSGADKYDSETSMLVENFNLPDLIRLKRLMTQKKNQMGLDPDVSRQRRLEIMMESAILDLAISVKRTIVEPGWWKPKEQISKYPLDNFQIKVG